MQSLTKNVGFRSVCGLKLMLGIAGVLPAPAVFRGLETVVLEAAMIVLQISKIIPLNFLILPLICE